MKAGNHLDVAARACGVNPNDFYHWLKMGENEILEYRKVKITGLNVVAWSKLSIYAKLFDVIDRAVAEFETKCVSAISDAGKKNYKAIAWLLERRHKERWADVSKLQVEQSGMVQHIVKVPAESKSVEVWEEEEAAIELANKQNGKELVASES